MEILMLRVMLTLVVLLMLVPTQNADTDAYADADGAADGPAQLRLPYFVYRCCRRIGMSRRAVVDHSLSFEALRRPSFSASTLRRSSLARVGVDSIFAGAGGGGVGPLFFCSRRGNRCRSPVRLSFLPKRRRGLLVRDLRRRKNPLASRCSFSGVLDYRGVVTESQQRPQRQRQRQQRQKQRQQQRQQQMCHGAELAWFRFLVYYAACSPPFPPTGCLQVAGLGTVGAVEAVVLA